MKRGATEAETCALNGWVVGTLVRGHESWGGAGVWTTWRITAIGEESVLVRTVHSEYTGEYAGRARPQIRSHEHMASFRHRVWTSVTTPGARDD